MDFTPPTRVPPSIVGEQFSGPIDRYSVPPPRSLRHIAAVVPRQRVSWVERMRKLVSGVDRELDRHRLTEPQNHDALTDREDKGGSLRATQGDIDASHNFPYLARLPIGYQTLPCWGFHDDSGRFSYEFSRVYGPPAERNGRGPIASVDEGLSYWNVVWPIRSAGGEEHPTGRWINYTEARKLLGAHLTFERFSSPIHFRYELPALLRVAEPVPEETGPRAKGIDGKEGD